MSILYLFKLVFFFFMVFEGVLVLCFLIVFLRGFFEKDFWDNYFYVGVI